MTLKIIGVGVGRTGTYSLKLAINQLGYGPCHHMEEVLHHMPVQLPLWQAAAAGRPDWPTIFDGYASAVDWPTAGFCRELNQAYPTAKFILTVRRSENWTESFSETIYKVLAGRDHAPDHMKPWLDMAISVIAKTGFPGGLDVADLTKAFDTHTQTVKQLNPADRLLVYDVTQSWEPLCKFLDQSVPSANFPRTNSCDEFWERIKAAS
jgi:Sulfotransferase domain